jgi:hypothetical protein
LDFSDDSSTEAPSLKIKISSPITATLKQCKITEYFTQHKRAMHAPSLMSTTQTQPEPTSNPQAKKRFKTTKAAIRSRLLHYQHPQSKQNKIMSFTAPLPTTELYDSRGHSLVVIDPTTTLDCSYKTPMGCLSHGKTLAYSKILKHVTTMERPSYACLKQIPTGSCPNNANVL